MLKAHQPEPGAEQRASSSAGYPIDPLVSKEDMRRIFGGVSLTTLANWADKPGFPKAIHLSPRCVRYKLSEVSEYLASLQMPAAARARTACPIADLAKEAVEALAIERSTGRPISRADAPNLFALHDQAMQEAAARPLCRSSHFTSGQRRFHLSITWSATCQLVRVEVRNEGGALVLTGDASGPIFLPTTAPASPKGAAP